MPTRSGHGRVGPCTARGATALCQSWSSCLASAGGPTTPPPKRRGGAWWWLPKRAARRMTPPPIGIRNPSRPGIVAALGGVYGPYTGRWFASPRDTDIEHIVARSEVHDSGLCAADAARRRRFASDLLNLTLASPAVNRTQKGDKDAVLATSFIRDGCGLPTPPFGSRGGARPTPGRPRCACRALRGQAAAAGSGSAARSPGAVAPR